MQQQTNRFFLNVDWVTILIYLALCIIGWINIYAAVYNPEKAGIFRFSAIYGKQLLFIISGLVLGFIILLFDSKFFSVFSPVIYGITMFLLVVVLVIGRKIGGNQAWISLGAFRLQPSEFAKFGTALLLAKYISYTNPKLKSFKPILISFAIIGLPIFLIMMQPDAGSALVFLSFMFPLFREGLPGYLLLTFWSMVLLFVLNLFLNPEILIISIIIIAFLYVHLSRKPRQTMVNVSVIAVLAIAYLFIAKALFTRALQPHQQTRIELILGLKTDNRGAGYNVIQSKVAIGSGQLTGRGFLQGTQTKYGYVPEQSTDFIFFYHRRRMGLYGLLCSYFFVYIFIAASYKHGRTTAINFFKSIWLLHSLHHFFHVFINIGMAIGIIPVIGIPLPLISYGGSSLWGFTILIFIFLKLDANRMGII